MYFPEERSGEGDFFGTLASSLLLIKLLWSCLGRDFSVGSVSSIGFLMVVDEVDATAEVWGVLGISSPGNVSIKVNEKSLMFSGVAERLSEPDQIYFEIGQSKVSCLSKWSAPRRTWSAHSTCLRVLARTSPFVAKPMTWDSVYGRLIRTFKTFSMPTSPATRNSSSPSGIGLLRQYFSMSATQGFSEIYLVSLLLQSWSLSMNKWNLLSIREISKQLPTLLDISRVYLHYLLAVSPQWEKQLHRPLSSEISPSWKTTNLKESW